MAGNRGGKDLTSAAPKTETLVLYARDVLLKEFLSLPPETSVLEASKLMNKSKHGFVIVGPAKDPVGIVTEWDILSKVVAGQMNTAEVTLSTIMTKDLISVDEGTGLSQVSQLMSERGIRRLLVKKNGEVIGVITSRTMLSNLKKYVDKVSTQISRLQSPWL